MMTTGSGTFIPEREFRERIRKIRKAMTIRNLDALVVYARDRKTEKTANIQYISGFNNDQSDSLIILPMEKEPVLILGDHDFISAKTASWMSNMVLSHNKIEDTVKILEKLRLKEKKLGIVNFDDIRVSQYSRFKNMLQKADLIDTTSILVELRMLKSPNEIKLQKECCEIQAKGFEAFFDKAKEGVPEFVLGGAMEGAVKEAGAEVHHMAISTGWPPDVSLTHAATRRKLKKGDPINICQALSYKGYFTQVERGGSLGKPNDRVIEVFNACVEGSDVMQKAMKPGVTCAEVAQVMTDYLTEVGLQNNVWTRYGHPCGLDYSERPVIQTQGPDASTIIKEGFTFVIHPGLNYFTDYHEKPGKMTYGDYVAVTKTGIKVLSDNIIGFNELISI